MQLPFLHINNPVVCCLKKRVLHMLHTKQHKWRREPKEMLKMIVNVTQQTTLDENTWNINRHPFFLSPWPLELLCVSVFARLVYAVMEPLFVLTYSVGKLTHSLFVSLSLFLFPLKTAFEW